MMLDANHRRDTPELSTGLLPTARTLYGRLTARGFDPAEAGNLTAFLNGLAPVSVGWDVDEVERLLFVQNLVVRGRLQS